MRMRSFGEAIYWLSLFYLIGKLGVDFWLALIISILVGTGTTLLLRQLR